MDNVIVWLIRLLTAHLLTDFVLYPSSWGRVIERNKLKAKEFWGHLALTAFVAAWFTCFDTWWVPLFVFITHFLIDWWKSYKQDSLIYFLIKQFLHILVIAGVWYIKFFSLLSILNLLQTCFIDKKYWLIGIAIIFLTAPAGVLIGYLTKNYTPPVSTNSGRANAGKLIGILERLVVFFLVMQAQYEAIGLLVAAKSIIRIKDEDREMSEYVLIGTLYSILIAIIIGFWVTKKI